MMNICKKVGAIAVMAALAIGALTGCGGSEEKKEAVLKVGTNATYLPFEFKGDDGGYQGFDMDLAQAIGKELGMKVEIHNIPFDGLINALGTGEIDMIASGMVITPERKEKVDFVKYYDGGLGIMVDEKLAGQVKSLKDLEGKRIAVQMATTGADAAHQVANAQVREFDHNSDAMMEMKQGGADAVIAAIPVMKYYLLTTADAHAVLVEEPLVKQELGLAVKKGNNDLSKKVADALKKLQDNGEYQKIYDKWFTAK